VFLAELTDTCNSLRRNITVIVKQRAKVSNSKAAHYMKAIRDAWQNDGKQQQ
jgi:hypothetical protein